MSRKDRFTGKVSRTGNSRSKALNITKRDWHFNVQTVSVINKEGKKVKITASVKQLRTLKKKGLIR
ncbi:50S ribosomal protein L28 [Candidatus Mycoplasma haematobovis]|uniref:Large ribosomal subunit protein bL28 n=1 Tax=Candidatus Mycoplasma haematobovis TaxID=432608 RepID=A0A1A9QD56_9MOLU|nr:L28 family ribosomal protein [Candidatus Mycoplasma haematobovis]OAL09896.1 50S ribosomal protein L28 [Candidatus Mycoplasma haematobovis]